MILEHNKEVFTEALKMLKEYKECLIVGATGIGKSNISTELLKELNINALAICPKTSIRDNWTGEVICISGVYDISAITYQYFILHYEELVDKFECYIFDEAQHAGSKVWGEAYRKFKEMCTNAYFIGLTADPNRYFDEEIDIVIKMFNDHIVYGLDQSDAIKKGIFSPAVYVRAMFDKDGEILDEYTKKTSDSTLIGRLNYSYQNCTKIINILQKHAPKKQLKGIVFVDSIASIPMGFNVIMNAFPGKNISFIHSKMNPNDVTDNLENFKRATSGIIIVVDMLNEGLHIDGINMLVLLRGTHSPSRYKQWIGRGLSPKTKDLVIFDLLNSADMVKEYEAYKRKENEDYQSPTESGRFFNTKLSDKVIVHDYLSDFLSVIEEIDSLGTKKNTKWTDNEITVLKKYYPIIGGKVAEMLPGRSPDVCRIKASHLGLKSETRKTHEWTPEEDEILRASYPSMGGNVYKLIPGTTKEFCNRRAYLLGIKCYARKWTDEEVEILKKNFPSMGIQVCQLLPNKTESACQHKAVNLGLKVENRSWSPEEDNILRKYYPIEGSKVSERIPRKTVSACKSRASILGLVYEIRNIWTEEEDNIIKEHYSDMGGKVCELLEGRTSKACMARAKLLKVKRRSNTDRYEFTKEEDDIIRKYYPENGPSMYKMLNNKTKSTCSRRANILGVRYNR